jgi:hypothetical protein
LFNCPSLYPTVYSTNSGGRNNAVLLRTPKKTEDLNPTKPCDLMELKERSKNLLLTTAKTFVVKSDGFYLMTMFVYVFIVPKIANLQLSSFGEHPFRTLPHSLPPSALENKRNEK